MPTSVYSMMVNGYSRNGSFETALQWIIQLQRDISSRSPTWREKLSPSAIGNLITGLVGARQYERALKLADFVFLKFAPPIFDVRSSYQAAASESIALSDASTENADSIRADLHRFHGLAGLLEALWRRDGTLFPLGVRCLHQYLHLELTASSPSAALRQKALAALVPHLSEIVKQELFLNLPKQLKSTTPVSENDLAAFLDALEVWVRRVDMGAVGGSVKSTKVKQRNLAESNAAKDATFRNLPRTKRPILSPTRTAHQLVRERDQGSSVDGLSVNSHIIDRVYGHIDEQDEWPISPLDQQVASASPFSLELHTAMSEIPLQSKESVFATAPVSDILADMHTLFQLSFHAQARRKERLDAASKTHL